jgi:glycerophosphoryl diester phosphodiesterase
LKLIAHRGNVSGPNPIKENSIEYIEEAISQDYDVEIDIRYSYVDQEFYLGHDDPQYIVFLDWLVEHKERLWIHCKNIESLHKFSSEKNNFNYFWHQEDDYTLTGCGYIWTYPGKIPTLNSIIVMPEMTMEMQDLINLKTFPCYGVCSDYISYLK